jgi:hypothetical protein
MNNPPAFPIHWENHHEGMTLRDYFAARAMQVILQSQYQDGIYVGDSDNDSEQVCARSAYIMADEMLKAREQ